MSSSIEDLSWDHIVHLHPILYIIKTRSPKTKYHYLMRLVFKPLYRKTKTNLLLGKNLVQISVCICHFNINLKCIQLEIALLCHGNWFIYVSLQLRVQNRRKKWNFLLNFHTMHKLSDLYSGIFQNYWLFNHLDVHLVWTTSETSQN